MKFLNSFHILKFDMLWVSASSSLFFHQQSAKWSIFDTPQDLEQFFDQNKLNQSALKVFMDGVPHRLIEGFRTKGFTRYKDLWQRKAALDAPSHPKELLFWHFTSNFKKIGFAVSSEVIQPWLNAINAHAYPLEGIYSLPFEICKNAQKPQLFILPTPFGQTRFIFGSPQGYFFYRLVDSQTTILLDQEIENTLVYLCRKFDLEYHHITVITDKMCDNISQFVQNWHVLSKHQTTAETFLTNLIQSFNKPVQASPIHYNRWPWFRLLSQRFLPWIAVLSLSVGLALSYQKHLQKNALQEKYQRLYSTVTNLKSNVENINLADLERQIDRLQPFSDCYQKTVKFYPDVLQMVQNVYLDDSILIAQISYTLIEQDTRTCLRLLIECQLNACDQPSALNDKQFERYIHHLQQKMTPLSLTHSYEQPVVLNEDFNGTSGGDQHIRCFIQMDLAL